MHILCKMCAFVQDNIKMMSACFVQICGYLLKESKQMRNFRAVLVEYVKDLVQPTWGDRLLSKDAHKIIVEKAVDKVLSLRQQHQIPRMGKSIKSYLYASRAKLEKLVAGYIKKYGKS